MMIAAQPQPDASRGPVKPEITYRIARTRAERISAFRLVYQNYVQKGLIDENPFGMRVTPYHLLPTTNVFIATQGEEILCTVTLIGDGELGIPMDTTNEDVVAHSRSHGLSVGEVSCLATKTLEFRRFLPIFVRLTKLMAQHARSYGMDQFLIATVPRHARFYQRFMGFEQVGEEKPYHTVCDTRGVACCLDFHKTDRNRPKCYDQYFGAALPKSELIPGPMSRSDVRFFSSAAQFAVDSVPALV